MNFIRYRIYDSSGNELWYINPFMNIKDQTIRTDETIDLDAGTYYFGVERHGTGSYQFALTTHKDGFVTKNGKTYYYKNGSRLKWLQTINGKIYYFNSVCEMQKGWMKISGKWYFFKSDGAAEKGWKQSGETRYFFDRSTGVRATGLKTIDGRIYYFNSSGAMQKGWKKVSGKWYFFKSDGAAEKGWKQSGKTWYFLDRSTGIMATGLKTIDGKIYYFNSSGAMQTGWKKLNNKWYYFGSDGAAVKGWKQLSGKWYYMNSSCVMVTYKQTIGGKIYYFNGSGVMQTGWKKLNNKWYYFGSDGAAVKGWKKLFDKWYFLDRSTAVMATGVKTIDGKKQYFEASGVWVESGIPSTFESYYSVIQVYQAKYGAAKEGAYSRYIGLFYAELIDFNNDGSSELVLGISTASKLDVYVFAKSSGTVKQIYHPEHIFAEGGSPGLILLYKLSNGTICLVGNSFEGPAMTMYYYGYHNGQFRILETTVYDRSTGKSTYSGLVRIDQKDIKDTSSYAAYSLSGWKSYDFDRNMVDPLSVTNATTKTLKSKGW